MFKMASECDYGATVSKTSQTQRPGLPTTAFTYPAASFGAPRLLHPPLLNHSAMPRRNNHQMKRPLHPKEKANTSRASTDVAMRESLPLTAAILHFRSKGNHSDEEEDLDMEGGDLVSMPLLRATDTLPEPPCWPHHRREHGACQKR